MASSDDTVEVDMPPLEDSEPMNSEDDVWDDEDENDEDDDCDGEDLTKGPVKCLFCSSILGSPEEVFSHCQTLHNFSLPKVHQLWQLDCIGYIKLINFIRSQTPPSDFVNQLSPHNKAPWDDDMYMQPSDPEDLLLQYDIESEDVVDDIKNVPQPESLPGRLACVSVSTSEELAAQARAVTDELVRRLQVSEMRATQAEAEFQRLLCDVERLRSMTKELAGEERRSGSGDGRVHLGAIEQLTVDEDEAYFSSYGHFSIHTEMLKDRVRTESYRDFMLMNPEIFQEKVVLDVGCGTGILSMFAVKAGAHHVIGVDQSEVIYQAMDIARENGLQDKLTLLKGRLEDITLPVEYEKVDIIVSEWMGYFLLFESMLDTVLVARDRFLKPGGCVYPDKCTLWLAGLGDQEMHQRHLGFWDNVYGFHMTCMKTEVIREAGVEVVSSSKLLTDPCCVRELDVNTCTLEDLQFNSSFILECHHEGQLTAIIGYFNVGFEFKCNQKVYFSTGPASTPTHWKQTVFLLSQPISVTKGTKLEGSIRLKKNRRDPRSLVILLTLDGKAREYFME